jgi:hypothetical protein
MLPGATPRRGVAAFRVMIALHGGLPSLVSESMMTVWTVIHDNCLECIYDNCLECIDDNCLE